MPERQGTFLNNPRATRALVELHKCVDDKFTGNITFDFKDGIPILCRKTEVQRFPNTEPPARLDGGSARR